MNQLLLSRMLSFSLLVAGASSSFAHDGGRDGANKYRPEHEQAHHPRHHEDEHDNDNKKVRFRLESDSFESGDFIPLQYTCFNAEMSPQLEWKFKSKDAKSFALIVEDVDAIPIVGYPYVHWNLFNIPGNVKELAEGASPSHLPAGSVEGANDDGLKKYAGPCPPTGTGIHHYIFALYAIKQDKLVVDIARSFKRSEFEAQYANDIIQKVEITGKFDSQ